jgi:hypothetical protein
MPPFEEGTKSFMAPTPDPSKNPSDRAQTPEEFDALSNRVIARLSDELGNVGINLNESVPNEELRLEIRRAAETCTKELEQTIGLEFHILLWLRVYLGERLRRGGPIDPTRLL